MQQKPIRSLDAAGAGAAGPAKESLVGKSYLNVVVVCWSKLSFLVVFFRNVRDGNTLLSKLILILLASDCVDDALGEEGNQ